MTDLAFLLILFGVMLIYAEFIWVGKLLFGIAGSLSILLALSILLHLSYTALGFQLIFSSAICFLLEAAFETYFVAGILASLMLGYGFWRLIDPGPKVHFWLAFPLSAIFGLVTTCLLTVARRARANKRKL